MVKVISSIVLLAAASGADACPSFGFTSPHLAQFFCQQFGDLSKPVTRDIGDEDSGTPDGTGLTQPAPDWMALPSVERAWRSDPAKTLLLIERLRAAGGRPLK